MHIKTISPEQVTYNPATNMFEALVTLNTEQGCFRYPCGVEGSIKMPKLGAVFKLTQQAKRRHEDRNDLCARCDAKGAQNADSNEFENVMARRMAA